MPDLHAYTYDEILEKYEEMKKIRQEERESDDIKESVYMLLLEVGLH
jgi:SUMO ligase MMS21 Smc5/6 complex component